MGDREDFEGWTRQSLIHIYGKWTIRIFTFCLFEREQRTLIEEERAREREGGDLIFGEREKIEREQL